VPVVPVLREMLVAEAEMVEEEEADLRMMALRQVEVQEDLVPAERMEVPEVLELLEPRLPREESEDQHTEERSTARRT